MYEFDVYGSVHVVNHNEVSGLSGNASSNKIDLSFNNLSSNIDLTGYKVYRNGTLITTLAPNKTTFSDSNLSTATAYSYKVTATYNDSYETPGITKI